MSVGQMSAAPMSVAQIMFALVILAFLYSQLNLWAHLRESEHERCNDRPNSN